MKTMWLDVLEEFLRRNFYGKEKKNWHFKNFYGLDEISLIVLEWEEFLKPTRLGETNNLFW